MERVHCTYLSSLWDVVSYYAIKHDFVLGHGCSPTHTIQYTHDPYQTHQRPETVQNIVFSHGQATHVHQEIFYCKVRGRMRVRIQYLIEDGIYMTYCAVPDK